VKLIAGIGKIILIIAVSSIAGGLLGIFPCYVFPFFGANSRNWCGYKSEPPYFVELFWAGFVLTAAIAVYLLYRRKRNSMP